MTPPNWKLYGNIELLKSGQPVALTVGNFDGVHGGHMHLIKGLKDMAGALPTVVMTFDPHPRNFFQPTPAGTKLCTLEDRVKRILSAGVDLVVVQEFSQDFANLSAKQFCEDFLLKNLLIRKMILGFDFRFGRGREGDYDFVRTLAPQYGFDLLQERSIEWNEKIISSSEIRRLVVEGDVQEAKKLLTRSYSIAGLVVKGDQRGRLLGYPTVNLGEYDTGLVMPKPGVYAGFVQLNEDESPLPAVMSFGVRPTFGAGLEYRAEGHIFDFARDVYGCPVRFLLESRIRGEEKFSDVESLKAQMARDCLRAREFLANI